VFGLYRYILALAVLISHLCGIGILGWLAVHGFFVLSGYLITLILHRNYGYDMTGFARFTMNRALRLFPIYWCVIAGATVLFIWLGDGRSALFYKTMSVPDTLAGWLENLTLIFPRWFPTDTPDVLSPPAWTLTIEWLFYILMALGLSRTPKLTYLWLGLSIAYFAITHIFGLDLNWRYSTLAAGALPFAIGAMLYHIRPLMRQYEAKLRVHTLIAWLIGLIILNGFICILAHVEDLTSLLNITFYLNMCLNAGLIMCLAFREKPAQRDPLERLDKALGDLSYPTYILHLPVAFALSVLVLGRNERIYDDTSLFLVVMTVISCTAIGLLLNRIIDRPIQRIRDKIRQL